MTCAIDYCTAGAEDDYGDGKDGDQSSSERATKTILLLYGCCGTGGDRGDVATRPARSSDHWAKKVEDLAGQHGNAPLFWKLSAVFTLAQRLVGAVFAVASEGHLAVESRTAES